MGPKKHSSKRTTKAINNNISKVISLALISASIINNNKTKF
jgi:hypothetical protein